MTNLGVPKDDALEFLEDELEDMMLEGRDKDNTPD